LHDLGSMYKAESEGTGLVGLSTEHIEGCLMPQIWIADPLNKFLLFLKKLPFLKNSFSKFVHCPSLWNLCMGPAGGKPGKEFSRIFHVYSLMGRPEKDFCSVGARRRKKYTKNPDDTA
jgi:hypothetical protein